MKKYLYVVKTQIIKSLTYEFNVYGNIIMQTIIMITSSFFWKALYKDHSISVQKGTVATDMMKPISLFGVYFAEDIGNIVALVFQNMIPILVIGCLMIRIPKMADLHALPLFVISVTESVLINWLIAALFGMIAFTAVNIDALIQVKKHLLRLLSGSIIPIWFFPSSVARVLESLPFVYIYQLPLSIFIGKGDRAQQIRQMQIQFLWLGILAALFFFVQNRVTRKVMVQGG